MKHPIHDRAEVSIDFPDKTYLGSFGRHSSFEITSDDQGAHLYLDRIRGEKRRFGLHVQYYLLADILADLGEGLGRLKGLDASHRDALREGLKKAQQGLAKLDAKEKRREAKQRKAPTRYRVSGSGSGSG